MGRAHTRVAPDASAPARARRYVSSRCEGLPSDFVDTVLLLTTELVNNALWHGRGEPKLDVLVEAGMVTVGVSDEGSGEVRIASDFRWPETGHGLRLVDSLSDRWGVEPLTTGPGKRVWFELTRDASGAVSSEAEESRSRHDVR